MNNCLIVFLVFSSLLCGIGKCMCFLSLFEVIIVYVGLLVLFFEWSNGCLVVGCNGSYFENCKLVYVFKFNVKCKLVKDFIYF